MFGYGKKQQMMKTAVCEATQLYYKVGKDGVIAIVKHGCKVGEKKKIEKAKCFMCGRTGQKMKKCWYYNPTVTRTENKKEVEKKIKEKSEAKREKSKATDKKQENIVTPVAKK